MKSRTREHEPVNYRDSHTRLDSAGQRSQHPARLRAVNVEFVIDTRIAGRNHDGLPFRRKPDMTDKTLIENSINRLAIEMAAFGKTFQLCSFCWEKYHGNKHAPDCSSRRKYALSTAPDSYLSARFNRICTEWRYGKVSHGR